MTTSPALAYGKRHESLAGDLLPGMLFKFFARYPTGKVATALRSQNLLLNEARYWHYTLL